ncbi:MAG: TetR/AcrR family transcriptional regulator [Proteobacteria bacterium]|nr:TetR/AcrR family transcriptional regulator [Pseudomonadota bacterium]
MLNTQTAPQERQDSRRRLLLDEAAALFCQKGYGGTSIRDIATAVGMLPGSIYYHFPSKEELLFAVYEEGVARITEKVRSAIDGVEGPWACLEAASAAHLETILDQSVYAKVIVRVQPRDVPGVSDRLVSLRDGYEQLFRGLIDALPIAPDGDPLIFRMLLLGGMNWTQNWYQGSKVSPSKIARKFVQLLRSN